MDAGPRYQYPTVLLIDPSMAATEAGRAVLRRIAEAIPQWVIPMVLIDGRGVVTGGPSAADRAETLAILPVHGGNRARPVESLQTFSDLTPEVVATVYRHYLQPNVIDKESD